MTSIYTFGEQLLTTLDLDPVYCALHGAQMAEHHRNRWLLAYWTYYHVGAASWISDAPTPTEFWDRMGVAAENKTPAPTGGRFPRGSERRHCRGAAAVKCVQRLWGKYGPKPEEMAWSVTSAAHCAKNVMKRVKEHYLFGDWIAFKVADMAERVMGQPVEFQPEDIFEMFDSPYEAAMLHYGNKWPDPVDVAEKSKVAAAVDDLQSHFAKFDAPPTGNRKVGLQEIETILCKYKSHLSGHYPVGKDTKEIKHALEEWSPYSDTAESLLEHCPGTVA